MLVLSYPGEPYEVLLQRMALFFETNTDGNKFVFPEMFGQGYFELVNLPMGIQALLCDFSIRDDYYFVRQKTDSEYYNLRFEIIQEKEQSQVLINDEVIENRPRQAYAFMNSSRYTLTYKVKKGMIAKSLNLRFSKHNIGAIIGSTAEDKLLACCVTNSIQHNKIIPVSAKMLELVMEILGIPENDPYRQLKIFNRSLFITEVFFASMHSSDYQLSENKILTNSDFYQIREIENIITSKLDQLPPKQEELATLAKMSLSKLKYTFKAIHGTSIYNYYQRARMEKALQFLQDGHTVSETVQELGFKDMTNFTRNFKRRFNIQPTKVRRFGNSSQQHQEKY
ncbi:hypothetical protein DC498_10355 [Terrimonas sp.]|nr:hypothetical protein DC498_10355 [Terrimonas sp.]